ncbi:hypothetical protein MIT9_P2586 [Methylomarinovum caldicuralii]|uniref:SPOR domain-containing protein n=1 Tax=Methylomarinovum caldicuralii TaxID=438856 RepID=A0AAU9C726_9GAMM|nr:hypothetical protein [Methylomarinovum caldicuralii]BCX82995.1 hypothetical protein MIT9_P2586 [Methylomarinovum caldicuralii]
MSRRLTYILLVANLLFFLWATYGRNTAPRQQAVSGVPLERITLVDEVPRAPRQAAETEPETEVPAAAPVTQGVKPKPRPPVRRSPCYRLGPLDERAAAVRLLTQFLQLGLAARVVEEEAEEVTGYWLMYPPAADLATARRNLARLRQLGWKDLWLFERGRWRGAISLGLYTRRSRAEALAAQLRAQGVEVEILPRRARVRRFWFESAQDPFPGWRAVAAAAWGWSVRSCARSAGNAGRLQQ